MNTNESNDTSGSGVLDKLDLAAPGVALALSKRISKDIDEWAIKTYDGGHRTHLGASLIGEECSRKLWYIFRWAVREQHTGRQQRLFQRGHKEEASFIEYLEGIDFTVFFEDRSGLYYHPESDSYGIAEAGKELDPLCELITKDHGGYAMHVARAKVDGIEFPQFKTSGAQGHFGGSLDGIAYFPVAYNIDEPVLLEFKTNGTGAGFKKLESEGMAQAKPQHYAQTCVYGADPQYNFRYVLYLNVCKNDDEMHVELVKLNHDIGRHMHLKAEKIVFATEAPPRISQDPTRFSCKFCAAKGICHNGEPITERNCRSCKHSVPIENKQWGCKHYGMIIPKENIPLGCKDFYEAIE